MKRSAVRFLSLLLVLTMLLSLVPTLSVSALNPEDYEIAITCPDEYTKAQSGYDYGEVIKTSYFSTTCERTKNVNIQLPANYDESKSYPVLYLLHGVMGSENDMLGYGTTIQNMVADGTAEEMIIVYPNMFSSKTMSRPSGINQDSMEGYDNFVNDLVNDLMPFVKETCSVKEGKENTAVAGFSMGGREALTIGLFRPDLFGYIGAFAPAPGIVPGKDSFMTHPGTFKEEEVKYEDEAPYLITICCGTNDSVVGTFPKSYHELYTKNGIDHLWWEIPGSNHGDPATSSGVYNFCKYVFKETAAAPQQPAGLVDIDFTDPAAADQFEILNQAATEIREGQGLYMVTTREAFEPCNGQLSTFAPKDVVKVPVGGNWTATLKFTFDSSGAANGYYQFFGFYASEGEDYNKLAGIRGGDGALQNFLRLDANNITADNNNSTPGLATAGTYWWRIVKDDTTYTCYRSENGEDFTEMFAYDETGIEADAIVIDAYTGMTEGYAFFVESLEFEGGAAACQHEYTSVVTQPSCTEGGYTTQTCSLCGKERITGKTDALGHEWGEGVTTLEPTENEAGEKLFTCSRCGDTKTQRIPPLNDAPNPNQFLFTADLHAGLDDEEGFHNLKAILPLLKEEGLNPVVITSGGDFVEDSYGSQANWPAVFPALEAVVKATYPDIAFAWTLGNHDWEWSQMSDAKFKELSGFDRTGMNFANEVCEIYQIGAQGNTTAGVDKEIFWEEDIAALDTYLASKVGSGKVIFVQTHWPLHRGYNWHWRTVTNAGKMIDTMNKYGDELDIVFLWGHNHYTDEMRNTIVQRGGSINYDENQSKAIKFTYASVGCMNDMYYQHSGHRDTMQGHGVCLSGEVQGDKLVLTYNRIDDAYETVGKGVLTHNADLTLAQSNTVLKNPAVVEVQLYNVGGSDIEPPVCEHDYKDGICTICGEADPDYVPDEPVAGDYVLAETVEAGKQYVVVSNGYALTNQTASVSTANGGTSLASTPVTVKDGILTSEVTPDMLWDFEAGTTTQANHPYAGFFVTNAGSKFLSRGSSGGAGVAPLNTATYDASNVSSKPHYAYWTVENLADGSKAMFLYSTTSSDYVFFLRGAAAGFDAPGTTQDGWQSAMASYRVDFYEIVEGEPECQHDYQAEITEPTCEAIGYTTYTCAKCGESYVADETEALGHDYLDGICTRCGAEDPDYVPEEPGEGSYVLASTIEAGKQYIVVSNGYALTNKNVSVSTSPTGVSLASTPVTVEAGVITSEVTEDMIWDFSAGSTTQAGHPYADGFFLTNAGSKFLSRASSSGTSVAPLNTETYDASNVDSKSHYNYWAIADVGGSTKSMFLYSTTSSDYVFFLRGSAEGFDAPGVAQDNWQSYMSSYPVEFYEVMEGGEVECQHDYEAVKTAPTCTEAGFTTYTCAKCGESYIDDEVDALGHKYEEVVTKPTCTEAGFTTFTCSVCQDTYKGEEVAATGHKYDKAVTEATCTAGGYTTYTCSVCGDSYVGNEVAALGHAYEDVVTKPTCTEAGFTTQRCSRCGNTLPIVGNIVAALGHKWDNGKVTTEPTVEKEGVKTYTCSVCQETKTESIPKLPPEEHKHVYAEKVTAPTCTEKGYTTYTCACGDTYTGNEKAALGHKYDEVVTKPTCTEGGYTTFTCSVCGDSYVGDEVDALGHTYEEVVTKPTCTEGGYTTFTCSVCKDTYKGEEVEATGHKWDEGKVTTEATEKAEGIMTYTCCVCQETKTEAIPASECPSKIFSDIPAYGNWAHEGIDYCVANKLMNGIGNGLFNPKGTLTRAELVTILYRAEGSPKVKAANIFTDVEAGKWYTDAIIWATENEIVNGIGGGKFAPNDKITREQIATILYRYAENPAAEGNLSAFPDAGTVRDYAKDAMIWATSKGIITGISKNGVAYLAPEADAAREQIASIIMRYLETK